MPKLKSSALAVLAVLAAVSASAFPSVRVPTAPTGRALMPVFRGMAQLAGPPSYHPFNPFTPGRNHSQTAPAPFALPRTLVPQVRQDGMTRISAYNGAPLSPRSSVESLAFRGRAMFDGVRRFDNGFDETSSLSEGERVGALIKALARVIGLPEAESADELEDVKRQQAVVDALRAGRTADPKAVEAALADTIGALMTFGQPQVEARFDQFLEAAVSQGKIKPEQVAAARAELGTKAEDARKVLSSWRAVLFGNPSADVTAMMDFSLRLSGLVGIEPEPVIAEARMIQATEKLVADAKTGPVDAKALAQSRQILADTVEALNPATIGETFDKLIEFVTSFGAMRPQDAPAFKADMIARAAKVRAVATAWQAGLAGATTK